MSNSSCAVRFKSVVEPRSTGPAGMTTAKIPVSPPTIGELWELSEICRRLGGPGSRIRKGGRTPPSGTSPSRRARSRERLPVPSERRHREGCASSDARHSQTPTCAEIFLLDHNLLAPRPVSNPLPRTMTGPTRNASATTWSRRPAQ